MIEKEFAWDAKMEEKIPEIVELISAKCEAYAERNKMLAAMCRMFLNEGCCVGLGKHEGDDWDENYRNIVFIELPTGQVSWHIHDSEVPMFNFLSQHDFPYDGHTTEEKWQRLFKCVSE